MRGYTKHLVPPTPSLPTPPSPSLSAIRKTQQSHQSNLTSTGSVVQSNTIASVQGRKLWEDMKAYIQNKKIFRNMQNKKKKNYEKQRTAVQIFTYENVTSLQVWRSNVGFPTKCFCLTVKGWIDIDDKELMSRHILSTFSVAHGGGRD